MGKLKNKKLLIALIGAVILIASMFLIVSLTNKKDLSLNDEKLKNDTAYKLYEMVKVNECADQTDKENNAILYLVFNQMKKDKVLASEISVTDYKNSLSKVVGNKEMNLEIKDYYYNGYKYNLSGNKIVREKVSCNSKKYVSKLYGYTYNKDTLELHVKLGFISDNKVYNLEGVQIGEYDEETINSVLEKGSMQIYSYDKKGDNYYLNGVKSK